MWDQRAETIMAVAPTNEVSDIFYKVVPPSDVSWFISPSKYRYIYHKP